MDEEIFPRRGKASWKASCPEYREQAQNRVREYEKNRKISLLLILILTLPPTVNFPVTTL